MKTLTLWKYHGGGNDFLLTDQHETLTSWFRQIEPPLLIQALTHRHYGIGADGVLLLQYHENEMKEKPNRGPKYTLTYWNSDGSGNTFCGNGGRVSAYHFHSRFPELKFPFSFQGWDGIHMVKRFGKHLGISFTFDPSFEEVQIEDVAGYQIHTGSPHFLWLQEGSLFGHSDFVSCARVIRNSPLYQKEGINVDWVSFLSDGSIQIRTYERGVEEETLSCGTGILAAALLYWKLGGKHNPVSLHAKGGKFSVWKEDQRHYWLIGPVTCVFQLELTFTQMCQILNSFQTDYHEMQSMSK